MQEGKWRLAYRLLEDGLISPNVETKTRAIELYKSHPEVRTAAAQTFDADSTRKTLDDYGLESGTAVARNRLKMYAVVANNDELQLAADTLQQVLDSHKQAKIQKELDTAKMKVEAAEEIARGIAKREAEAKALNHELERTRSQAFFRCKNKLECEKAFSLTQIYIATNTDMKIQMANDTVIETYNPNKSELIGATAFKIPKEGTSAEIRLIVTCKTDRSDEAERLCKQRSILLNSQFPTFLKERLVN